MSHTPNQRGGGAASRREQLRLQQEAAAQRERRLRIIGVACGVVALALILIVGGYLLSQHKDKTAASNAMGTPVNANAAKSGIVIPASQPVQANAPTLVEYQDYQCPACKQYWSTYGKILDSLADKGEIRLEYHTMTFLDTNMHNDSSTRAAIAAACADNVGAYQKYHDTIYQNQPAQEGTGYTDDQLRNTFAAQAGITGDKLTTFQKCYDTKATQNFVKGTDEQAAKDGITETPTFRINGKDFKLAEVQPTEIDVLNAIKAAA